MQKNSLLAVFTLSGTMCVSAAFGLSHYQELPLKSARNIAAIATDIKEEAKAVSLPRSYKIASTFRRSRQIWGVYDKYQDRLVPIKQPGQKTRTIKRNLGELILKNGQMVLVSPLESDGSTHIEIAKLPYTKKGKNSYNINLEESSPEQLAALTRLYAPLLEDVDTHEKVTIADMNCLKKKSKLSCELNLILQ